MPLSDGFRDGLPERPPRDAEAPPNLRLEPRPGPGKLAEMKFVAAFIVILLISLVLCLGMGLAAHGHGVWLLVLGIVGFLGLFIRYGCQTH